MIDAEVITNATNELSQVSHKLAEQLYAQKSQDGQQPGADQAGQPGASGAGKPEDDDVVDADFEEVKEDDKK